MKTKSISKKYQIMDLSGFSDEELSNGFIFPVDESLTASETEAEKEFWEDRRKNFENRTPQQKIYSKLLQLKFQLDDYVGSKQYKQALSFGYFLNEYVSRQGKADKEFAFEVDIKPTVLSQYINNHRKPTDRFIIRLELHSNGMIPALDWFKLLQKEKEFEFNNNKMLRREESKHVKSRLEIVY